MKIRLAGVLIGNYLYAFHPELPSGDDGPPGIRFALVGGALCHGAGGRYVWETNLAAAAGFYRLREPRTVLI